MNFVIQNESNDIGSMGNLIPKCVLRVMCYELRVMCYAKLTNPQFCNIIIT